MFTANAGGCKRVQERSSSLVDIVARLHKLRVHEISPTKDLLPVSCLSLSPWLSVQKDRCAGIYSPNPYRAGNQKSLQMAVEIFKLIDILVPQSKATSIFLSNTTFETAQMTGPHLWVGYSDGTVVSYQVSPLQSSIKVEEISTIAVGMSRKPVLNLIPLASEGKLLVHTGMMN